MKRTIFFIVLIMLISALSVSVSVAQKHSYKPKEGYVPDAETAIKIAEAVLIPIYGEKVINGEKPLKAELKDGIWIITGTLHCPEGHRCLGGVAEIEISKDDGRVLRVTHGE